MNNDLVIGNTSQLSYYFPENYQKISSRNIDYGFLKSADWDSVYLTFAEQRVHLNDLDFITPNFKYTMEVIERLIDNSNRIVIYTSCEMWNKYQGKVYINSEPLYEYPNDYVKSKLLLRNRIYELREKDDKWFKVVIIHPFYFNSVYRRKDFLFGKIFDSIINKKAIEIGYTYFKRDMVHTKYMVERSIKADKDEVVGAGQLFDVNRFIRDLYKEFNMDYSYYVNERLDTESKHKEKNYYSQQNELYLYETLLKDTINDLKNKL